LFYQLSHSLMYWIETVNKEHEQYGLLMCACIRLILSSKFWVCCHKNHWPLSQCPSTILNLNITGNNISNVGFITWTHLTVSVCPTIVTLHAMLDHSSCTERSQTFNVWSVEPLTNLFPIKWRHLTVPECPTNVMTDQGLFVRMFQTFKKIGSKVFLLINLWHTMSRNRQLCNITIYL
jgi:hypothetical protein